MKPTLYVIVDIEADGPVPPLNSMLSVGMVGMVLDDSAQTFTEVFEYSANLKELDEASPDEGTQAWWSKPEQAKAWKATRMDPRDPEGVFRELNGKIESLKETHRLIFLSWPSNYDWQWINYYFHRFVGRNPFGHSARCIASYLWGMSGQLNKDIDDVYMEKFMNPQYPHTHVALEDARSEAHGFMNAFVHHLNQSKTD